MYDILKKYFYFCAVGFIGAILHFSILGFLFKYLNYPILVSQGLATFLTMINNYHLNNTFVYKNNYSNLLNKDLFIFICVCILGGIINLFITNYLYEIGVYWIISCAIGVIVGSISNFILSRLFIWRE